MKAHRITVERCNHGEPIIAPTHRAWETGVTFNAAALYLKRSAANDHIISALLDSPDLDHPDLAGGVVAIHYRARPEEDPGFALVRSFIGLAIFTPDFRLLRRWDEPVLSPCSDPESYDAYGVEDPRITRFGDVFYMVYCGPAADLVYGYKANLCLAVSRDLIQWDKLGPLTGDVNATNNKDGVLFPNTIDGKYYLLHRPCGPGLPQSEFVMRLASSGSPTGPWQDCGEVLRAFPNPAHRTSWVGAGSVPIAVGEDQYAVIYHTGNFLNEVDREYDLDAALFDFAAYREGGPAALVRGRIEHLMVPETAAELRSRSRLQVANVLFACGSYSYSDHVYIIYGGADTYTLAARVNQAELFAALQQADLMNPFIGQG